MDWTLKAPSWDLSDFEQETIHNTNTVDSSSSYGDQRIREEFSIDLKLGRVGNWVENSVNKLEPGDLKMAASPSGSSKRARAASTVNQTFCLVDGCTSDLSNCREYHRRHKVCELHSKTPQVTIGGQKQRFCQQCSRFHSLDEFDEGKRSCRKRLDGHNRRRRKPQPEPLSHSGSFFPNYQGSQLLPFASSHIFPSTTMVNPTWPGVVNTEDLGIYSHCQQLNLLDKQNVLLGSSANSYNREKQFTFLQGDNILNRQTSPGASSCLQLLKPIALSESGSRAHSMFCDGLTTQVYDSSCALSLLSSPQTQTSGIRLSHMVQPNSIPLVQPSGPSLHHSSLEPVDAVMVSSASSTHMAKMFQIESDESSSNQPPQSLPFHWQ